MKPRPTGPDDIPGLPPFVPRLPDPGPGIHDQIRCPPGSHRPLGGGPDAPCVSDAPPPPPAPPRLEQIPAEPLPPSTRDTSRDRPPKEARGPLPPVVVTPPTAPPPTATLPDATTGRYFPRTSTVRLPTLIEAAGRVGLVLWVLGTLVFQPYLRGPLTRPQGSGPPRRRTRPRASTPDEFPFGVDPFRTYSTLPRPPGTGLLIPRRDPDAPTTARPPRVATAPPRTLPGGPGTLPGTRTPVRRLPAPAPAGWTLGDPLAGPGYDPFTYAAPAPRVATPRAAPRTPARPRVAFPLPFSLPGLDTRSVPSPLTRQPQPRPRAPLTPQPTTPRLPRAPGLTPRQDPVPTSQPQPQRKPTSADPCTAQRTERRRRQKDCKRFTAKTIRVCADRS